MSVGVGVGVSVGVGVFVGVAVGVLVGVEVAVAVFVGVAVGVSVGVGVSVDVGVGVGVTIVTSASSLAPGTELPFMSLAFVTSARFSAGSQATSAWKFTVISLRSPPAIGPRSFQVRLLFSTSSGSGSASS